MNPLSEIKESIQKMASKGGAGIVFTAKVKSVESDTTCTVELDGLTVSDVRLRAVVNSETSKILVTPKTGSYVLVADLSGDLSQLAVVGYSEVEKIEVDANDEIVFNGGENHGLVKIKELTDRLNNLVDAFNQHTHTGEFEGTIGEAAATGSISTIPTTQQHPHFNYETDDYEDTKITH